MFASSLDDDAGGQPGGQQGERPPRGVRRAARSPPPGAMVGRGTAKANPRGDQRGYLQEKEMQWSQVAVNIIVPWHSLNNSLIEMQGNMSGEFKAYLPCWAESGRKVHCCGGIVDLSKRTLQHLDKDYTNIVEKHGRT